ncbi:MAG: hypothetical protein M0010_04445 [Actinomycetota bacterium]|nr:hypothetical protein [Actinomycetota bacterium]
MGGNDPDAVERELLGAPVRVARGGAGPARRRRDADEAPCPAHEGVVDVDPANWHPAGPALGPAVRPHLERASGA